jgi:hypothetical protein
LAAHGNTSPLLRELDNRYEAYAFGASVIGVAGMGANCYGAIVPAANPSYFRLKWNDHSSWWRYYSQFSDLGRGWSWWQRHRVCISYKL